MEPEKKKKIILVFATLATVVIGFIAAHPSNMKIVSLIFVLLVIGFAFLKPRLAVFGWLTGSAVGYWIWRDTISNRFSLHAALSVFLLLLMLLSWLRKREVPSLMWWEWLYPIFGFVCLATAIQQPAMVITPLVVVRDLLFPFVIYLFAKEFLNRPHHFDFIALISIMTGVWIAYVGYLEYHTGHRLWSYPIAESQISRAIGPYRDQLRFGFMQLIHFFLGLYALRTYGPRMPFKAITIILGIVALLWVAYSTAMSSQRAVVIAVVLSLAVQVYYLRHRVVSTVFIISVVLLAVYNYTYLLDDSVITHKLTVSDVSSKTRVAQYISAGRIIAEYPLFGIGYHYFDNPRRTDEYTAHYEEASSRGRVIHNSMLYSFAAAGMFAGIPYLLFRIMLILYFVRAANRTRGRPEHLVMITAVSITLAHFFVDQFSAVAYGEILNSMYFLVVGAMVGQYRYRQFQNAEEGSDVLPVSAGTTHVTSKVQTETMGKTIS